MAVKQKQRHGLPRSLVRAVIAMAISGSCLFASCPAQTLPSLPISTSGLQRGADVGSFEIQLQALEDTTSAPVVTALSASHEGRFLAVAGDDHAIRVLDVRSGTVIQTFIGHLDWIQSLVFVQESMDPDAAAPMLYSAGNDGRVLEWKYEFPVRSREVLRLPYAVRSISVSADQKLLAIGGFSKEILIWDLASNRLQARLSCECEDQRCVRFSPDGSRILCGGRDGELLVWDVGTGDKIGEFHQHRGRLTTAAFSVDGSTVTSAGEDRQLVRLDLSTGQTLWRRELGRSKLHSMCLINDGLVAVAGADNKIRLFDALADGIVAELEGHWGTVAVMAPCGEFLASGSFDTTVRIWDLDFIDRHRAGSERPVVHAPLKMNSDLRIR